MSAESRIVVNHLTRMQSGLICVAGLSSATKRHVRPIARGVGLSPNLLATHGGPFAIGAVVELGATMYKGQPPETEDLLFDTRQARRLETLPQDQFWQLLRQVAQPRLADLFGPDLTARGRRSCGVDVGKGRASLGCLRLEKPPELYVEPRYGRNQVRLRVRDGQFDLDLSVADIRLYQVDHLTPNPEAVADVVKQLAASPTTILSVGLSRAFAASGNGPPLHWLQVNNLHFHK
jgi:hypothetical protein